MILCTPYHPSVPVDYQRVVSDLTRLAGNKGHTVLVISRPEDEQEGLDIAMSLSQSFGRHYNGVLQHAGKTTADTANLFFRTAMRFLGKYQPEAHEPEEVPMLYFDPMWRPKGKFWMDKLQSEWFLKGKPAIMGNPGDPENPDFKGGVIVGRSFTKVSTLVEQLPEDTHWRKFLAWEMLKNAVITDSIGDTDAAILQPRPQ